MITIGQLRKSEGKILSIGSHHGIIQSMLDFDFLSGKREPRLVGIIASGKRFERYFFGGKEIALPVFSTLSDIPSEVADCIHFFLNVTSGRRVLPSSLSALDSLTNLKSGVVFAEDVPEEHAIRLRKEAHQKEVIVIGPASVGLLLPGVLKLGAIGGVDPRQLIASDVFQEGSVAVFSASGGMTNEIIRIVKEQGKRLSFALSFGGDRFPILSPKDAFLLAENDPQTASIVYFGELGGTDEYEIVALLKEKKITKEVICYIGGVVADLFETPPQFGHAKAMAKTGEEKASAKRAALKDAGAKIASSFANFVELVGQLPSSSFVKKDYTKAMEEIRGRRKALFTTTISYDKDGDIQILGEDLLSFTRERSFAEIVSSLFLGKQTVSSDLEQFVDFILRLLVDHGPYVSGAVNTMITARAGRDLVSSLSTGLLTIGPRFGGAINEAAGNWLKGVQEGVSAREFVERFAKERRYISGIGHRKYRVDFPDPRVKEVLAFSENKGQSPYTTFAKEIEKVTVAKKGNLILNVDGAIAAVLLDILSEKEQMSEKDLEQLVEVEFFNALFVLSRSVGFISHFLDQKRRDEGLFRLKEDDISPFI